MQLQATVANLSSILSPLRFYSFFLVKRAAVFRAPVARSFGAHAADHGAHGGNQTRADGIVIPELVDTLEWVLESPPNVHQFEEPPVSASPPCLQVRQTLLRVAVA